MGFFHNRSLLLIMLGLLGAASGVAQERRYDVGRTPTEKEISAWDAAIGPSGKELPPGQGTATEGAKIYAQKCASCHGATGQEERTFGPKLIGGKVASYWPFATTLWDYINRAMPRNNEGSLRPDEVYALTAFLLYRGGVIKESDVVNAKTLPAVVMPRRNAFVPADPVWKPSAKRRYGYYPKGN